MSLSRCFLSNSWAYAEFQTQVRQQTSKDVLVKCKYSNKDEDKIIKGFQTIVFIFIVISTMFQLICPPAFFRCLSNLGTYTELWTMSFIESIGVACSDSINHNQVQVLRIPVLLLACSQDWTCNLQMIVTLET